MFIETWDAAANGGAGAWLASAEPTSGLPVSSVGNPFMWTGHRYDAAVGLYATLYRTYSPTLGRWLQRDPIEYASGSINLYEYGLSGPMLSIDPFGLDSLVKGMCGGPPPPPEEDAECKDKCNKEIQRLMNDLSLGLRQKCEKKCEEVCKKSKKNWGESWNDGRARGALSAFFNGDLDCGISARNSERRNGNTESFRESAERIQEEVNDRGDKLGKKDHWKHFVVSCRIASELQGGFVAILPAGLIKEIADNWPSTTTNRNPPGGIADSIMDMMANTAGWVQSVTTAVTGKSCEEIAQEMGLR